MTSKRVVGTKTSEPVTDERKSKRSRAERAEPTVADILYVQHCMSPQHCVESGYAVDLKATREVVKLTPGQKQVVELRKCIDPHVIMFVAMGYKYRLYGRDSHTAARRLGIFCIPSDPFEYSSVPTGRVGYHSARLVGMGYVVCIVDQESAALKQEEGKKGLFERTVRPYISRGTMMEPPSAGVVADGIDAVDDEECDECPVGVGADPLVDFSNLGDRYMLFICESVTNCNQVLQSLTLISFVTGKVYSVTSNVVNEGRDQLKDLMMIANPVEVICCHGITPATTRVLRTLLQLNEGPTRTGSEDTQSVVFVTATGSEMEAAAQFNDTEVLNLPLQRVPSFKFALQYLTKFGLAVNACGFPHHHASALTTAIAAPSTSSPPAATHMYISGTTLRQLDVLSTTTPSGAQQDRGSLLWLLHRCSTAMGYRLLRTWLAKPIADQITISGRLDVVEWLKTNASTFPINSALNITGLANSNRGDFEATVARLAGEKATPKEYLQLLSSLRILIEKNLKDGASLIQTILSTEGTPKSLVALLTSIVDPKLLEKVKAVESLFLPLDDPKSHEPWNLFISPDYDEKAPCLCNQDLATLCDLHAERKRIENDLEVLRRDLENTLGIVISFRTVLTAMYLLEIDKTAEKKVPREWTLHSRVKTSTRFTSPRTLELVGQMAANTEKIRRAGQDAWSKHQRDLWSISSTSELGILVRNCVQALAELDVLTSFSSLAQDERYTRPEMLPVGSKELELLELRHPVLMMDSEYVANDVVLNSHTSDTGEIDGHCWILTGPNMGGKSALMRSVALAVLLAHIGCFVPCARGAKIPTFTAIRSRMGAEDAILQGQSTFLTEMIETAAVLQAQDLSTSLVLMDEIGRGTSSFDGVAVASAVLQKLSNSKTLGFFVTHYPEVCVPYQHNSVKNTSCKFMDFRREAMDKGLPHRIVFLYKVVDGVTPSSFGINIALTAGLPSDCVKHASDASKALEQETQAKQMRDRLQSFLEAE